MLISDMFPRACYYISMATKKAHKIQDSEVVRAKARKQAQKKKVSKFQEALALNETVDEVLEEDRKGLWAERFAWFAWFSFAGSWAFCAFFRLYTYMGKIPGYSSEYAIQLTLALAPAFLGSTCMMYFAALLWSRLRKNYTRLRRVNYMAICAVPVLVSIILLPVGIGAYLYLFGYPICLLLTVIVYIWRRLGDKRDRFRALKENEEKTIKYWNLSLLIVFALLLILNMVLTEMMAGYLQTNVQRFQDYAQFGTV